MTDVGLLLPSVLDGRFDFVASSNDFGACEQQFMRRLNLPIA